MLCILLLHLILNRREICLAVIVDCCEFFRLLVHIELLVIVILVFELVWEDGSCHLGTLTLQAHLLTSMKLLLATIVFFCVDQIHTYLRRDRILIRFIFEIFSANLSRFE